MTPMSQDSVRSSEKRFEGQGSAPFDSGGLNTGLNIRVFADKGVKSSESPAGACPAGVGSPFTARKASGALSPSEGDAPETPALKTRCPSGFSPLEYAQLPDTVRANEARILVRPDGCGLHWHGGSLAGEAPMMLRTSF